MIDYEKSAELNGMEVEELKVYFERFPKSNKKVVKICDACSEISNVNFDTYRPLCHPCSKRTPEAREAARMKQCNKDDPTIAERMSARKQGIPYEEWEGFIGENEWRDWDKAIYINEPFLGCHRHHLTKTIVAYIPAELHGHIWHNLRIGHNMGEINTLAIQFINGGL